MGKLTNFFKSFTPKTPTDTEVTAESPSIGEAVPVTLTPSDLEETSAPPLDQDSLLPPSPQFVAPSTQPVAPSPQPVAPSPQFVAPSPQSVVPNPQPVVPNPQPVVPNPQPVAPSPQPVVPSPQPVAPSPQPVAPSPQPVAPSPQPVAPSPQFVAPSTQPVAPSPQPVAPSPQPVAPSPQPVAPSPQFVAPSPQPVAPNPQPVPSTQPVASIIVPNPDEFATSHIVSNLTGFVPPPELLAIASQLSTMDITQAYAQQIDQLAHQPSLDKSHLSSISTSLSELSTNYSRALAQIKDPVDLLSEYHENCILLSHYIFQPDIPTYENFLALEGFDNFKKALLILLNFKKLFPTLYNDPLLNLEVLTTDYSVAMATFNQLTPQVQALLPLSDQLRTDIITFTNTVNQVQSQNKMSADWNGKKQPLMQLRQQLAERREVFIEDEEKINQLIANLYATCSALHERFQKLCPILVKELKQLIDSTPRDPMIMHKRQQIEHIAQTLSTITLQLDAFQNTLTQ